MYEKIKKKIIIILLFSIIFFSSCASRRFYDNRIRADAVRDNIAELEETQCETAFTNSEIGNKIERSQELTNDIKTELESGKGDLTEFEKILQRIRERNKSETTESESDS